MGWPRDVTFFRSRHHGTAIRQGTTLKSRTTMNKRIRDQWQIAMIWMRDANMASTERTPRGLLDRLGSLSMAEHQLDRYFEMVEEAQAE